MKNLSLVINGVLLVAVIILYVLFFKQKSGAPVTKSGGHVAAPASGKGISIAYFNMDSLENGYAYIKDIHQDLRTQEENMGKELDNMKKNYMARVNALQQRAQTMNQQEGEAAQREINQMQVNLQQKEAQLTQQLQAKQFNSLQDINKKIEEYLKTYNQEKGYAFIFSHQPGDFIYFRDSAYNITDDIVAGLNAGYKKKTD